MKDIATLRSAYLGSCDENFNPSIGLSGQIWNGAGYHTQIPNGTYVHPTRENFSYALTLLGEEGEETLARGDQILQTLLPLQDLEPTSPTFGIWPWLYEEALSEMRPPDWNWADFCGIRVAHILCLYGAKLSASLRGQLQRALEAAAWSIFRRNVQPVYTNIAVKGAVVAATAGEILADEFLLTYARSRLRHFLDYTEQTGGFTEYNSPGYGVIVMTESERGLLLIRDQEARDSLEQIRSLCWEMFSQTLHLPTGQICGPQSRAYTDAITPSVAETLAQGLGVDVGISATDDSMYLDEHLFLIPRIPCPESIRQRFFNPSPQEVRKVTYHRSDENLRYREATIWMSEDACLGSINLDNLWTQRRPILGYWQTPQGLAVLRVRLMNGSQDFASGLLRSSQQESHILALATLASNKGNFHDHLDAPSNGAFDVSDFHLSVELHAPGVCGSVRSDGWFVLTAEPYSFWIHPELAMFSGSTVEWVIRQEPGFAAVAAEVGQGKAFSLKPADLNQAAWALQMALRPSSLEHPPETVVRQDFSSAGRVQLSIDGMDSVSVEAPLKPEFFV